MHNERIRFYTRPAPASSYPLPSTHVPVCGSTLVLVVYFWANVRIWTGCDYICSAYDDGQDAAFYMCHDRIVSLTSASLSGEESVDAVLGCQVTETTTPANGCKIWLLRHPRRLTCHVI